MAFNNPYYYPMQPNAYPTQMNVGSTQQQHIQNGGFISVRSEQEVFNYPVAPGNCVTFKIEGQPVVMEKSMGFSQLEAPHIERYRLVKEEVVEKSAEPAQNDSFDTQAISDTIDELKGEIESIWSEIEGIKNVPAKKTSSSGSTRGDDRHDE